MLLRFRVANHKSLRDTAELSLASSRLHGNVPPAGDSWIDATTRVAGIYGANASGKSTVLYALDFMVRAIANSATIWANRDEFPYYPYRLDRECLKTPSMYEIDIVVDGVRYTYGFESDASGIHAEWLYSYHTPWKRMLFTRAEGKMRFGRTLGGENQTIRKLVGPTNLFLSVAANSQHPALKEIHRQITRYITYAAHGDNEMTSRVRWARSLVENTRLGEKAESLMRLADLGICGVRVEELDSMDEKTLSVLRKVHEAFEDEHSGSDSPSWEEFIEDAKRVIRLQHSSGDTVDPVSFGLGDESDGTIAWISLCLPALYALDRGEVYLVDELDSSLHPRLSAVLIHMFKDPDINPKGAQLIFTSHDVSLIGKLFGDTLSDEEVWFIEKSGGASELYALQEFPVRSADNFEKRYLEGRYGAIPMVETDEIRSALLDDAGI